MVKSLPLNWPVKSSVLNDIGWQVSSSAGLSNTVEILKIGLMVSEIAGGETQETKNFLLLYSQQQYK